MTDSTSKNAGDREGPMASMMEMMPKMMQGMMSQCCGEGSDKMAEMQGMMAKMKEGGPEGHMAQMPEMMLNMMLPHCIEMMLPKIDPDKRGAAAAGILSKIIEKGSEGMSDEQAQAFRKALDEVVNPSK